MNFIELIDNIDEKNKILKCHINYFKQLTVDSNLYISIDDVINSYQIVLTKFEIPLTLDIEDIKILLKSPKIQLNDDTIKYYTFGNHLKSLNKYFKKLHFDYIDTFTLSNNINLSNKFIFQILFTIIDILIIIIVFLSTTVNYYITSARAMAVTFLINIFYILCQYSDIANYLPIIILQYFPYSDKVYFHKLFALKSIVYASIHTLMHMLNIKYILNLCKDGCNYSDIPFIKERKKDTIVIDFNYFNKFSAFITGYMLVAIMIILGLMAIKFHYYGRPSVMLFTHRILCIIFFILIILHGVEHLLGFNFSYIFILPLFIVFLYFRISEVFECRKLKILNWDISHENIITLWLNKSNNYLDINPHAVYNNIYPSCALFIKINKISNFEWHPFTVSTGFTVNELVLNINIVGQWTKRLKSFLQNSNELINTEFYITYGRSKLSAFRFYKLYKTNIFVCSNLGIAPYISLMRDIIMNSNNYEFDNYFIWSVNSIEMIKIISDILNEINLNPSIRHLKIYIYYSNKNNIKAMNLSNMDILSFYYLQLLIHSSYTLDIISNCKLPTIIILGRSNISNIIKTIINKLPYNSKIGIFTCGSKRYCEVVKSQASKYINNSKNIKLNLFADEGLD